MPESSDVRSIDALRELQAALLALSERWDGSLQQIKFTMHRIEEHFKHTMPSYWTQQLRLAEQKLTEALDNLSRLRGTAGPDNAPAATEAKQRVNQCRRRLSLCEAKLRAARGVAAKVDGVSDDLSGPIAQGFQHVQVTLPGAARELSQLIEHLDQYHDRPR